MGFEKVILQEGSGDTVPKGSNVRIYLLAQLKFWSLFKYANYSIGYCALHRIRKR